ncbi:MAG: hypothetical protein R2752_08865 [Vicinamibacterales bacterium]
MAKLDPGAGRPPGDSDLSATYVRALVVQVVVLAALYWLSRHFS